MFAVDHNYAVEYGARIMAYEHNKARRLVRHHVYAHAAQHKKRPGSGCEYGDVFGVFLIDISVIVAIGEQLCPQGVAAHQGYEKDIAGNGRGVEKLFQRFFQVFFKRGKGIERGKYSGKKEKGEQGGQHGLNE